MSHCLGFLANIDGAMHNLSKSKVAKKVEDSTHSTSPEDINVVLVNAIFFRTLTERQSTFGELAQCLVSKLIKVAPLVHLVCDTYMHSPVKDPGRMKPDDSTDMVCAITGPNQTVLHDWQRALESFSFKQSFLRFLSTEWEREHYGAMGLMQ